jgi:hypothetical protein
VWNRRVRWLHARSPLDDELGCGQELPRPEEALHLLATSPQAASVGAIPSWLELSLPVQVRADSWHVRAGEASPHP